MMSKMGKILSVSLVILALSIACFLGNKLTTAKGPMEPPNLIVAPGGFDEFEPPQVQQLNILLTDLNHKSLFTYQSIRGVRDSTATAMDTAITAMDTARVALDSLSGLFDSSYVEGEYPYERYFKCGAMIVQSGNIWMTASQSYDTINFPESFSGAFTYSFVIWPQDRRPYDSLTQWTTTSSGIILKKEYVDDRRANWIAIGH